LSSITYERSLVTAEAVVLRLRGGVDPPALVPAEWLVVVVAGDDVLAKLGGATISRRWRRWPTMTMRKLRKMVCWR